MSVLVVDLTRHVGFVVLTSLRDVGNNVIVQRNAALDRVRFSSLAYVGGDLKIFNNFDSRDKDTVARVEFPNLSRVHGSLQVTGNTGAALFEFPVLSAITGSCALQGEVEVEVYSPRLPETTCSN